MSKLERGVYRLTEDIPNPKPDRRYNRDWRMGATIKAGTEFAVENRVAGLGQDWVEMFELHGYSFRSITQEHPLWDLIEPKLVKLEPTCSQWLKAEGCSNLADDILDRLVADHKISRADVEFALKAILEEP